MSHTINIRAGSVKAGTYTIRSKGLLTRMLSEDVSLVGAQVSALAAPSDGTSMARAAAIGGLLTGGLGGVAAGALLAKKGLVMFQVKWADGSTSIGEAKPEAFRELLVAQCNADHPKAPMRLPNLPGLPGPAVIALPIAAVFLLIVGIMVAG